MRLYRRLPLRVKGLSAGVNALCSSRAYFYAVLKHCNSPFRQEPAGESRAGLGRQKDHSGRFTEERLQVIKLRHLLLAGLAALSLTPVIASASGWDNNVQPVAGRATLSAVDNVWHLEHSGV